MKTLINRSKPHLIMLLVVIVLPRLSASENPTNPTSAPLSIEAVVKDVMANNPEIRFYEAELAAAKGERRSDGQWANPEVATEVGRKRTTDREGAVQGEGTTWSVAVSQTFEWPGRGSLRKSIANRQVTLAENGLAQFRALLSARASVLAFNVDIAQQKAEAARATAERFSSLQEIIEQRQKAGVGPQLEARILEANGITYRRRASEALKLSQQALLDLNQLRGQELTAILKVAPTTIRFATLPKLAGLLASARTDNLDLRQRKLELERQGFQVDLAHNERFPSVTVSPYYSEEKSDGRDRFVGVGVSLPFPIWDRNAGGIDTALARQQQAEISLRLAQSAVERRIVELTRAYQVRLEEMDHWREDPVKRFREAADLSDHHYRLGAVPIATYIEAQKQSLDALDAVLETRRETLESALQLEIATSSRLHLFTLNDGGKKP